MSSSFFFQFLDQKLFLLSEKAIYWQEKELLLIADLHLGKANHFQKAGIPISSHTDFHTFQVISKVLDKYQVQRVVFLGDLFHSRLNGAFRYFTDWVSLYPSVQFELVVGNHDTHTLPFVQEAIIIHSETLIIPPFILSHEPLIGDFKSSSYYNLCGHIHPSVSLRGKTRQTVKLPCFFFGKDVGILPAFGKFTGKANIKATTNDKVFVITQEKVIAV